MQYILSNLNKSDLYDDLKQKVNLFYNKHYKIQNNLLKIKKDRMYQKTA
jgi:hypothetical protein